MDKNEIDSSIRESDYLRQRLSPDRRDYFYLSLSDLLIALRENSSNEKIDLLDYGCGGSPYRSLFPHANYKRADFLHDSVDILDYELDEDSHVNEQNEAFDLILSTQVAEHVRSPRTYFSECFRLLKPGGKLICSTHGYFPDHGFPHDYQRWTSEGLARDLRTAGFEIVSISKLTTGSRAFFSILDFSQPCLSLSKNSIVGLAFWFMTKVFSLFRTIIYRALDNFDRSERVVIDTRNEHSFYIGLVAVAKKTGAEK